MGCLRKRSRCFHRAMMKDHQLITSQRHLRVRSAFTVTELDFVGARAKRLHDGADLAADQAVLGKIHQQRHHVEYVDGRLRS